MKWTQQRPHLTSSSRSITSELYICFTSRLSSLSMKLSSKSILSPSHSREPSQISLSSSLSRRLRSNGSIKGGHASPMFPTSGKKRFENPEPSSPKVTCIGQVRVKTKKQGKNMRTRSKRRVEASFRKTDQSFQLVANPDLSRQNSQSFRYQNYQNLQQECLPLRNQRWVHLPLTICEALRAFGAEFNCLFPCRSSCTSSERDKEEKAAGTEGSGGGHATESSCGVAVARWLVALQEGDAKGREVELVVGEEERTDRLERSQRRHVLEDIDLDVEKKNEFVMEEEEKARVSICIPPKNALLLMRCRSDPVKMAALANRFWESPLQKDEEEEEDNGNDAGEEQRVLMEEDEVQRYIEIPTGVKEDSTCEREVTFVDREEHLIAGAELEAKPVVEIENGENPEIYKVPEVIQGKQEVEEEEDRGGNANQQDETLLGVSSPEVQVDLEKLEIEEVQPNMLQEDEEKLKEKENDEDDHIERRSAELASSPPVSGASESENNEEEAAAVMAETSAEATEESTVEEERETTERLWEDEETATQDRPDPDDPKLPEQKVGPESKERETQSKPKRGSSVLPDCLLLMMCEPKLSMEVSKETWVCSTDFVRWLPEKPVKKKDGGDEPKKRISIDSKPPPPPLLQPPRSSCSFPAPAAGMSMATRIEQKLVESNAYEPFVLTRCKSEPMRSSAKLAPEASFWKKNRKLGPDPPAGAAGV